MHGVRLLCSALLILLFAGTAHAGKLPDTIIFSPEVMAKTKQRILERDPLLKPAYDALIKEAERAVTAPAESVILKPSPPSGEKQHTYWSLDPEWWPDPKRSGGLPYMHRPGESTPKAIPKI